MHIAALDTELSRAVVAMARAKFPQGFDAREDAPDTFDNLCALLDAGKRMVVYSGASDATIFGSPLVNWHFRAWHDWHHWQGRLPFTPEGEAAACNRQVADLFAAYGAGPRVRLWARILDAEVNGQLRYAAAHGGNFPCDQRAFVVAYLDNPAIALATEF